MIQQRFEVGYLIGTGAFGKVHQVIDLYNPEKALIIKFQRQEQDYMKEATAMINIKRVSQQYYPQYLKSSTTPEMLQHGQIINVTQDHASRDRADEMNVLSFMVMTRFGSSFDEYIQKNKTLPSASVFALGIHLINLLEQIHQAGYIYNDLKPDNILVGHGQKLKAKPAAKDQSHNIFKGYSVNLVDFGFSSEYIDFQNQHCNPDKLKTFRGNLIFSSLNKLQFQMPSRRDDMLSLGYLLVYLLNDMSLPNIY